MIRSYQIRIFPTQEQEQALYNHIGACRFIWNYMLEKQNISYADAEGYLSSYDMINLLKPLKSQEEFKWLYEVSNTSLQIVCQDLNKAFLRFFAKQNKYPRFKSRKYATISYPVDTVKTWFDGKYVHVLKVGKIKYKTDRTLILGNKHKLYNPRITKIQNKWFISFGYDFESQEVQLHNYSVGVDIGVKSTAVVAYNDEHFTFSNINKSKKVKRLVRHKKYLQRKMARKYRQNKKKKSKNYMRTQAQYSATCYKIHNIRSNYIHHITHFIVHLLPYRIVVEDLNVQGMMKNRYLAPSIQDQCFHEILRQINYKAEHYNIQVVKANRFYPSSKTCSCCGYVHKDLKLSDRIFVCPNCGFTLDRDYNATINLMRYEA